MAKRSFKRAAPILIALPLVSIGFIAFRASGDGLDEVRKESVEVVSNDGIWIWHEFQFKEPCKVIKPKLADWKPRFEASGRTFAMTDMEDGERGPQPWARDEEFTMGLLVHLRPGNNCGFAVGLKEEPSGLDKLVKEIKRFLHLK